MNKYLVEYTIEKEDGSVRHESFECENMIAVRRVINVTKPRNGETIILIDCRLVESLF